MHEPRQQLTGLLACAKIHLFCWNSRGGAKATGLTAWTVLCNPRMCVRWALYPGRWAHPSDSGSGVAHRHLPAPEDRWNSWADGCQVGQMQRVHKPVLELDGQCVVRSVERQRANEHILSH